MCSRHTRQNTRGKQSFNNHAYCLPLSPENRGEYRIRDWCY